MSSNTKPTAESNKATAKFDNEVWGGGVENTIEPFEFTEYRTEFSEDKDEWEEKANVYKINKTTSPELISEFTKLFFAMKDAQHNGNIAEVYKSMKIIMIRLTGKVPKKEWRPNNILERVGYELYMNRYETKPTKYELKKFMEGFK